MTDGTVRNVEPRRPMVPLPPIRGRAAGLQATLSILVAAAGACSSEPVAISAGGAHGCALLASGGVFCWGSSHDGQVGDGSTSNRPRPVPVKDLSDAVEVSAGNDHTCARRSTGTLVCWGSNEYGQLGDGTTTTRAAPVAVLALSDAVGIATGSSHTCARRAAGTVVCWGRGVNGQLGDGSTSTLLQTWPTPVSGLTDAAQIAAGSSHTCARRVTGAVVCWGEGREGQLGDGSAMIRAAPVAVAGLSDAVEITAGGQFSCARRASGSVVCWGSNRDGQLGSPAMGHTQCTFYSSGSDCSLVPLEVAGLSDVVGISAGGYHACARRSSGTVVCWGWAEWGQLGQGSGMVAPLTTVSGLTDAVEVSAGFSFTCARRAEGAVVCWGGNDLGQLGDGLMSHGRCHNGDPWGGTSDCSRTPVTVAL